MSIPMGRITGHFSPYKDSRIILVGLISFLIVFGALFIYKKRKSMKNEEKIKNNMILLEPLDRYNKTFLLQLNRGETPLHYAPDIAETVAKAEHNATFRLPGRCFAIKYRDKYVGLLSFVRFTEDIQISGNLDGKECFSIYNFLIDSRYQGMGIGSNALKKAIKELNFEYKNASFIAECHKDNEKAIRFFENNGFRSTGRLSADGSCCFMVLK